MTGTLYLVPTPVGNLEDMTLRAIRTLKEVDLILAEDTRTSGMLLKHFEINTPMRSHHKFNEHTEVPKIVERLKDGENIALITDAGTPGISDPGFLLARECVKNECNVVCLPGATALIPALAASGLPCDRFIFEGFLPPKKGRATRLDLLAKEDKTVVIYESPKRLARTLNNLCEYFGNERRGVVAREISKLYETFHRGTLRELAEFFSQNNAKGEIVILIEGQDSKSHKHEIGAESFSTDDD